MSPWLISRIQKSPRAGQLEPYPLPPKPLKYPISYTDLILNSPVRYSRACTHFHMNSPITTQTHRLNSNLVSNKITIQIFYRLYLCRPLLLMGSALFLWFSGILKPIELLLCPVIVFHAADVHFCSPSRLSQFSGIKLHFSMQNSVMEKVLIWIYFFSVVVCVHDSLYNFFSDLTCKHVDKPKK